MGGHFGCDVGQITAVINVYVPFYRLLGLECGGQVPLDNAYERWNRARV